MEHCDLCVLKAPVNWTTSKCLAAVWEWNNQHCAEISRFKLGRVRLTLAFKPGSDSLAPADTQQQDSQWSEAIFRWLLWVFPFVSVESDQHSLQVGFFLPQNIYLTGCPTTTTKKNLKIKLEGMNKNMAVVKCCRHHLDVFAKICMFASDTSSTNNAPLLQMKRLIWQQKVENKTWHITCKTRM